MPSPYLTSEQSDRHLAAVTKHGLCNTPAYRSWQSMKDRCCNPNNPMYHLYGGRGITVCDSWLKSFEAFLADIGDRPEGTCLDRIDNDGDYTPDNCKWSTPREQANNRRDNRLFEYCGETKSLTEWCRVLGRDVELVRSRINHLGWEFVRAIETPRQGPVRNRVDMTGQTFGRLLVTGYVETVNKRACWLCLCSCGTECVKSGKDLRQGKVKSCGCLKRGPRKSAMLSYSE